MEESEWPIVYSDKAYPELHRIMEIFQSGFQKKIEDNDGFWDMLTEDSRLFNPSKYFHL